MEATPFQIIVFVLILLLFAWAAVELAWGTLHEKEDDEKEGGDVRSLEEKNGK